ncbi:MAG: sulfurtransferase TusA family protein [Candidatus Limnocylindrales bacterium]
MTTAAATILGDAELAALTPAKVVDARGAACPGPLLEAKKGMGAVAIGQVIEVLSSDAATKGDIGGVGRQGRPRVPGDPRRERLRPGVRASREVAHRRKPRRRCTRGWTPSRNHPRTARPRSRESRQQ